MMRKFGSCVGAVVGPSVGFGIAVAIGNTIGAGIVRTPGEIAGLLPSTWLYFAAWAAGGIYMTLGAMQFAELGADADPAAAP